MRLTLPVVLLACACASSTAEEAADTAGPPLDMDAPVDTAGLVDAEADVATDLDVVLDAASEADIAPEVDINADVVGPADVPFVVDNPMDLLGFVDPRLGTAGSGNVAVGAAVPHGWVRAGPETDGEALRISAYHWDDAAIRGFTHTNLSGPGGSAYGYSQVRFTPWIGALPTKGALTPAPFTHDHEVVSPGYYAVTLTDPAIEVELTATGHAARHRYTFPASDAARLVIDLGASLGQSVGGHAELVGDHIVEGFGKYQVHPTLALLVGDAEPTGFQTVYMVARFSRPFVDAVAFRVGDLVVDDITHVDGTGSAVAARFDTTGDSVVEVEVGLSLIDVETARANLDAEVAGRSFEEVRLSAGTAWNDRLNRVQVEGPEDERRKFYTGLYHVMLQPVDYTEARVEGGVAVQNRQYFTAFDGKGAVFDAIGRRYYADDWCAWDTYRTAHPLRTLIEPEVVDDVVQSYVHGYEQGGWLEKCPWSASGYSRVMIANASFPIIADALTKGFHGFDRIKAYEAMTKSATQDNPNALEGGGCGYLDLGTPASYREQGWVADECDQTQAASMTLEYAYDDWCLAQVATALGDTAAADTFTKRSLNWKNQFNPAVGFMQSRRGDGTWREPFDPADGSATSGFVESTSWTYTFHVPHDVPGLAALLGGADAMVAKLDLFFDGSHFDIGNEPGFHIPWLYTLLGAPDKTESRVAALLAASFSTSPGGLPGNDDSGATSAWLAFAQLGLYPVAPGDGRYVISAPTFTKATLALHPAFQPGGTFVIEKVGDGPFIQSVTLNEVALDRPYVTHAELGAGGTLRITMGAAPGAWAPKN